jgi:hypothetical protein
VDACVGESTDHPGDVGVRADPTPVLGEHESVDGADLLGEWADLVQQADHHPLQRHGQRQPRPLRTEPGQEPGHPLLVHLEAVVAPVAQTQRGVGGAVQRRGQRMGDR